MKQSTSNPLFWGFKVAQGRWFWCKSKWLMGLNFSDQ